MTAADRGLARAAWTVLILSSTLLFLLICYLFSISDDVDAAVDRRLEQERTK